MMKKICFMIILLLAILGRVYAYNYDNCEVIASFKLTSSLDDNSYICKGSNYGKENSSIFYDSSNDIIYLNNANIYYFTNYGNSLNIDISGDNNINMLHLDKTINITGLGSLRFREDSYTKRVENGEKVYYFVYKNSYLLDNNKNIYEGTLSNLAYDYNSLKSINKLSEELNEKDYILIPAVDYINMVPVSITPSWLDKYINIYGNTSVDNGYGIIKGSIKEDKKNVLKTDEVTLVSDKKINKKYKLKVNDLTNNVDNIEIEDGQFLKLYDISIFSGKKQVEIKNGQYVLKIKLDKDMIDSYDNYEIVYVSKDKIEEHIEGEIEGDYIIFKTSHLSQYGIVGYKSEKEVSIKENINNSSNSSYSYFYLIIFILLVLFVIVGLRKVYKKTVVLTGSKR